MSEALAIFPRERIDFGRLGLPVAHLSRDQRDLLELLVTFHQQGRARQRYGFLAKEMKCSRRHVMRLAAQLEQLGEIVVERTAGETNSFAPGPAKAHLWADPIERSAPRERWPGTAGCGETVECGARPVTGSHPRGDWQAPPPVTPAPPDTPRENFHFRDDGSMAVLRAERSAKLPTTRVARRARRATKQIRDERTGLLLTLWDPMRPWGRTDRRRPHERLRDQVESARREGSGVWAWSQRAGCYRRIERVSLSVDGRMMILCLEPMDGGLSGGGLEHFEMPTIGTTSLELRTDRWGNDGDVTGRSRNLIPHDHPSRFPWRVRIGP